LDASFLGAESVSRTERGQLYADEQGKAGFAKWAAVLLKALEPPDAMTFVQQGEDATQEAKEKLRREIAYLEAVLAIGNPVGRVLDR
jgi:hypothetical protein